MLNIFVNTWGNYNEHGAEGGQWITLPMDADELTETLEDIAGRINDPDPKWAIHDYEWTTEIKPRDISEMEDIAELNEWLKKLESLNEWDQKEIAAAMEALGYSFEGAMDKQQQGYFTFFADMDLEEVAEQIAVDCYMPDSHAAEFYSRYFDYKAFARDLSFSGYNETSYGVIVG